MTIATPSQYWLAPGSITLTPNAEGNPNLMQVQTPADACLLAYMPDVPELDYDVNHNFRKWYVKSSNVCFGSDTAKYIYLRIPRTQDQIEADPLARDASGNPLPAPRNQQYAELCYPSDHIDAYGCTHTNEYDSSDTVTQVGSRQYIYVFLQGIISANNGSSRNIQNTINFGTLSANMFIKREGACSFKTRDFPDSSYIWHQFILDGQFLIVDDSMFPQGKYHGTIWIPSPKAFDGQTFEVKLLGRRVAQLIGGLSICSSNVENLMKKDGRGQYPDNVDYFYASRDPEGKASENIFATTLNAYGKCSFTITSVRMAHSEGDPFNDWVWVVDNLNVYYKYLFNPYHPESGGVKGIAAQGRATNDTPDSSTKTQGGWITRDGFTLE